MALIIYWKQEQTVKHKAWPSNTPSLVRKKANHQPSLLCPLLLHTRCYQPSSTTNSTEKVSLLPKQKAFTFYIICIHFLIKMKILLTNNPIITQTMWT